MSVDALSGIDVVQLTQDIREQINRRSGRDAGSRLPAPSTGALASINDELEALQARLSGGEQLPAAMKFRDRLGSFVRRRLYRFLWWQSEQLNALVELTLRRGREEKKVLDALAQSMAGENHETYQLVLQCKRQIHELENRLQQLETAQLKQQAAEIERSVHARAQIDTEWASLHREVNELKSALSKKESELQAPLERISELGQRLDDEIAQKEQIARRVSELGLFTHETRASLSIQDRRLGLFMEQTRKHLPEPISGDQIQELAAQHADHRYDSLYAEFEDIFRGTREEIKARQAVYLPALEKHGIGSPALPLLDLGCGRGEWLEFLKEHGLQARGVDRNDGMVERCRRADLDVTLGDALPYLSTLPDACLGAITSFHMVEHMPFEVVLDLIDECLRVLKSGGILILETPNPQNILVGSHTFYLDPTHRKPLPSPMLRFFVEARGFCDAHVLELQPYPRTVHFPDDGKGITNRLNDYFYGPQDYAVIGRRP
jgi:SAM-dependent methyltransferase